MPADTETIFALSSGGLPAGVAVVRLSGPLSLVILSELIDGPSPAPRQASLRTIRTRNGLIIDRGLVLAFPGPSSFTGEDCSEFHVHGGKAVVAALLHEFSAFQNCRMAEHGEFTRRAMENGRMDLVEVEGLADLIGAETEMQRRLALEHAAGGLSQLYSGWADRLTRSRALIEAELDFADEDDVPGSLADRVWSDMALLRSELTRHLDGAAYGEIVRDGLKVVIAGPPNAGKSSLMNALARRDIAIVTEIAGTTRDVLHVDLDIGGYAIRLYDTAGLRESHERVEQEGIRRALKAAAEADVLLSLAEIGQQVQTDFADFSGSIVRVGTKADIRRDGHDRYDICISSETGEGLGGLNRLLLAVVEKDAASLSLAVPSRLRHRLLLSDCLTSLNRAVGGDGEGLDIRAEHLRQAAHNLGRITGRVDVEDLLGVIFSEFCIGK